MERLIKMSELYVYPQDDGIDEMVDLYRETIQNYKKKIEESILQRDKEEKEKQKMKEYRKQYREKNKEKIKESNQKWLDKNKEQMLEKRKEKMTCQECGGTFRKDGYNRHIVTQKHKLAIQIKNSPYRKK